MQVSDIMESDVRATTADAIVADAITTIADAHVSGLPVVDGHGNLVGVISTSDILSVIAESESSDARERFFADTQVQEIMSRQPMTIEPDATLKDAAERLLYLDVHRLFVVTGGTLVGVVSQTDIARTVATSRT